MSQKPARKATVNDLLDEYQMSSPKTKQLSLSNENVQDEVWDQSELQLISDYNNNIHNIDELYSSVQPLGAYIVRVFLIEPEQSNGVFVPYKQLVSVPTQNGMAEYAEIESPFPYSNRAIIVATPPTSSFLSKGDVIQLGSNPVKPQVNGRGNNATVSIPSAYIHPDAKTYEIPRKIDSKHYGYLIVPVHEIIAKL